MVSRPFKRFATLLFAHGVSKICVVCDGLTSGRLDANSTDVIIVGAGQAGMVAAHRLVGHGYSVVILEATDHVGGRTRNFDVRTRKYDIASDDVMEVGGTWLSPHHTAALGLCDKLGISVFNASFAVDSASEKVNEPSLSAGSEESWPWWFWGSDYPKEQTHLLKQTVFHGEAGRFLFRTPAELAAGLPAKALQDLNEAGLVMQGAAAAVDAKCWNMTGVPAAWRQLDKDSTWGSLGRNMRSKDGAQALRNCIHGKNAQEPEAVSFLYNTLSFKGCDSISTGNSAGPDSQFRVRGGTQAIPLAIASRIPNSVKLGHAVQKIHATQIGVSVLTKAGARYNARAAIVTGPPPALLGIEFDPPLSAANAQLLQRMPMGTSLKFSAVYTQGPWWRKLGLQGDILSTTLPTEFSLPGSDLKLPLFVQCMDHSPYSRQLGVIACFMEGRQNLHFTQLPLEQRESLLIAFLVKSFNDTRAETFKPSFVSHDWADQPYARGAYTGYFPPGVMSVPEYWEAYRDQQKAPNVFVAGSDYHAGFGNGYIEGAIRDGQKAADTVQERLSKPKSMVNIIV